MTDAAAREVEDHLAAAARLRGRRLGRVFVEDLPTDPSAFEELLTSLQELPTPGVIVPTKVHLGRWDIAESKYAVLQRTVRTEVIVADAPASP
jgi:hypothetical protein